jgi:hypothetical protein
VEALSGLLSLEIIIICWSLFPKTRPTQSERAEERRGERVDRWPPRVVSLGVGI